MLGYLTYFCSENYAGYDAVNSNEQQGQASLSRLLMMKYYTKAQKQKELDDK